MDGIHADISASEFTGSCSHNSYDRMFTGMVGDQTFPSKESSNGEGNNNVSTVLDLGNQKLHPKKAPFTIHAHYLLEHPSGLFLRIIHCSFNPCVINE